MRPDPAGRDRPHPAAFRALRWEERREGALSGRAVEISRNPRVLKGIALIAAVLAIGAAIAVGGRAWDQFSSPDVQFPEQPAGTFLRSLRRRAPRLLQVAVEAFGEKPVLGHGAGTYQFSWDQQRSIELPVHDAHSLYLEAFAELGVVGGLLVLGPGRHAAVVRLRRLARRRRTPARALRGSARRDARLCRRRRLRLDLGDRRLWERSSSSPAGVVVAARCARSPPTRAASTEPEAGASASPSPPSCSPGSRRRPGRAAAGRARDRRQPECRRRRRLRRRPSTTPKPPARSSPGPPRPTSSSACSPSARATTPPRSHFGHAIEREDRNWQWYYLQLRVEHEAGEDSGGRRRTWKRRGELNPLAECLREGGPADERQGEWQRAPDQRGRPQSRGAVPARPSRDGESPSASPGRAAPAAAAPCCAACSRPATGSRSSPRSASPPRHLDDGRRQALLGGPLHPGLAAGDQAARPLRQRPPPHPPQHAR